MSNGESKTISGDCFAVGDLLITAKYKGEQSGTGLLGKINESPIILDYIKETHHVDQEGIPLALLLGTDWEDFYVGPRGRQDYFDFLVKQHPNLNRQELDDLKPEPARPDILTRNGPNYSLAGARFSMSRNEYYEIKPDSPSGLREWAGPVGEPEKGKKYKLAKFYRRFGLPYNKGTTYPAGPLETKFLPLPVVNNAFMYLASIFIKRHKIKRVLLYISVRRHEPGLLLYKVCIEIETDDQRKQQALAKAAAKTLYATYVVCHFPERFSSIEQELGDYSFEGDKFPRVRCTLNVIDELKPAEKSLTEAIYMRGIGLPGEKYLVCCDETYYQSLIAKPQVDQVKQIWEQLQAKAEMWVTYAAGSIGWSKVKPLVLEIEKVAKYIKLIYPDADDFANMILNWVSEHPYLTVALIVTSFVVTAGVAAFLEAGLLAEAAVGTEAAFTEATATQVAGGLGRIAMTETVATPILTKEIAIGAGAHGFMSVEQIAAQISGMGAAANDVAIVRNAIVTPLLSPVVKKLASMGVAAAFLLMVNTSTAYAQDNPSKPVDAKTAKIIAQHASSLFMVRALDAPSGSNKPPIQGSLINLRNYAEPEPQDLSKGIDFSQAKAPIYTRYLGRITIS